MTAALTSISRRLFPRGPLDALFQFALFYAAYYGYGLVRGAIHGKTAEAFTNGQWVIDFERSVGIFIEPTVQGAVQPITWLSDAAAWAYPNVHFTLTPAVIIFIYIFRNESYYFVRNMLMVAMGIALVGYLGIPTAPPRFFAEYGFVDSVSLATGVKPNSPTVNALFNPYAAMPSMHCAFALMIGAPMVALCKRLYAKILWAIYPIFVALVTIVTGNHFVLDVIVGWSVAIAGGLISWYILAPIRPNLWRFMPERIPTTDKEPKQEPEAESEKAYA